MKCVMVAKQAKQLLFIDQRKSSDTIAVQWLPYFSLNSTWINNYCHHHRISYILITSRAPRKVSLDDKI